jgi:mannose-6-phosphate isomerase-like protein (cupin superfamily)
MRCGAPAHAIGAPAHAIVDVLPPSQTEIDGFRATRAPLSAEAGAADTRSLAPALDDELPRESLAGGILERTAVRTDDAIVTFNWIQPGHPEVPPHDHPYDQLSFVFSGTLELELDGTPSTVTAGELLYIPASVRTLVA